MADASRNRHPPTPAYQMPEQGIVTKFHALRPPSISIRDYLERCVEIPLQRRKLD